MADSLIARLKIGLSLQDKAYQAQMKNALRQADALGSTFKKVGGIIAGALSVTAVINFSKSCIELGSNLAEVQNVVDTVFPSMNEQINEWSRNTLKEFGLSETVAKNYSSTLGAMARAFGYSEAEAYSQATALTELAGDMASFYNKTTDETFTALKAVYSGETEVLKQYGVVMTETALNEFALAQGMGKVVNQMSEQEKVALRLAFVQDRLALASGDFSKTQDSWANQTRILSLQWEAFKANIGQGLISALTNVIIALNQVMESAVRATSAFAQFMALVFPHDSDGGVGTAMAEASESANSMASGLSSAGGSAKKLKGILAGFDKLNILNSASGGGGGGGGSSLPAPVDIPMPESTNVAEEIQSVLYDAFKKIDFTHIKDAFNELKEAFEPIKKKLGDGLKWIWENVLKPLGKWTISEVIPRFLRTLAGVLRVLNAVLDALKPLWDWFWENVLKPIAQYTADAFLKMWDNLNKSLNDFADWLEANPQKVAELLGTMAELALVVGGLALAWNGLKLVEFIVNCGGVAGAVTTVIAQFVDLEAIATAVSTAINGIAGTFAVLSTPAGIAFAVVAGLIAIFAVLWNKCEFVRISIIDLFETLKDKALSVWNDHIKPMFASVFEVLKNLMALLKGVWDKHLIPLFTWIAQTILPTLQPILKWIGQTVMNLVGIIASAIQAIMGVLNGIIEFITGVLTGDWSLAWQGISDVFTGVWDGILGVLNGLEDIMDETFQGIVNVIKGALNTGIGYLEGFANGAIGVVNAILGGINSVGEATGLGSLGTIPQLSLPRLAQGGFVEANTPQLAVIGDNRHEGEIVAPESKITEAVTRALAGIVPAIGNAVGSAIRANMPQGGDTNVTVTLDGQVIYDTMQEYAGRANSRSGGRS